MADGVVTAIHLHPVKACRRVEVSEATVAAYGFEGDRVWQVVDADGAALTQRQHPVLATVVPEPLPGGLRLSAPGQGSVECALPERDDRRVAALLGDEVPVGDGGEEVAAWLSRQLGQPCRLVAITSPAARRIPLVAAQPLSFVDAGPVLVATLPSLRDLQERASAPFGIDRFRPNLVIDGNDAWAEDTWSRFDVGGARLEALAPWPRCAVPQVDQDSGARTKEPAVALRAHRWCDDPSAALPGFQPFLRGKGLFGIGCTIAPEGAVVRVGDTVVVRATAAPLIPAPPK